MRAICQNPRRHSRESGNPVAFARTETKAIATSLDSRFRGNDGKKQSLRAIQCVHYMQKVSQ